MAEGVRDSLLAAMAQVMGEGQAAQGGQPQANATLGLMGGKVNPQAMAIYAKDPTVGKYVNDPAQLMAVIDSVHKRESRNSPGTSADLFVANKANEALSAIYGINDYTPQGFNKLNEELPKQVPGASVWQNPRPAAGEMITGPYGQPLKR